MTAHKDLEKRLMLDLQGRLPRSRVLRWDNGTAYAVHSVHKALAILHGGGTLAAAQSALIRLVYGNEGYPDLTVGNNGIHAGIEVKIGKDKLRDSQLKMKNMYSIMGHPYYEFTDKRDYKTQLDEVVCLLT